MLTAGQYCLNKNLFDAVKNEVARNSRITFMISDDNLREIRETAERMRNERAMVAKDWKEFLKMIPAMRAENYDGGKQNSKTEPSTEAHRTAEQIEIDEWMVGICEKILKPGEYTDVSDCQKDQPRFALKDINGEIQFYSPQTLPTGYIFVGIGEGNKRFYTIYGDKIEQQKQDIKSLVRSRMTHGVDMDFFARLNVMVKKYDIPASSIEIPFFYNGRIDEFDDIPMPPELIAHFANFASYKKTYQSFGEFGAEFLKLPQASQSTS